MGPHRITSTTIVNAIGMVIVVMLAATLAQTVYQNYTLNRQIEQRRSEIDLLKAQNQQLQYNIEYYKTESFREREARAKLGLQMPGESVIILPTPKATPVPAATTDDEGQNRSNWGQWMDFLSGRDT